MSFTDATFLEPAADRLRAVRATGLLDTAPEQRFDRLTRLAVRALDVPVALVSLIDQDRQFFKSQCGLPEPWATTRQTPLEFSFCRHVADSGEPLVVSDARKHPMLAGNPIIGAAGVIAYAGIPLVDRDGVFIGSFCAIDTQPRDWTDRDVFILQDLAAVAVSEIKLERDKELAETANRAKDRFLAMLSHELRAPLSPALLICGALIGDESLPPNVRDDARTIERNVRQQTKLVDDLLDVTRIENGKLSLSKSPTDLGTVLSEVVDTARAEAAAKRVGLTLRTDAPRCFVDGDPVRLKQVFGNLTRNAIKFTPSGGRVEVRACNDPDGAIVVTVSDTGIGIDGSVLPDVFNAFEQGSRSITDEFSGLGLGLAIAKGLVDGHGGSITAHSDGPGTGTRMTVRLPTVDPPRQCDSPKPPVAGRKGRRILLVEDHRDTLRVMTRLLKAASHDVVGAASLAEAELAAADADFDVLISDIDLPDGSGLDLLAKLNTFRPTPGIALTGYGMESDVAMTRAAGFKAHLVKPLNFHDLEAAIGRVCDG